MMKESAPEAAEALLAWQKLMVSNIPSLTIQGCFLTWHDGNDRVTVQTNIELFSTKKSLHSCHI